MQVSLPVVRGFVKRVEEKALGVKVIKGIQPSQQLVKVVNDELISLMGSKQEDLVDPSRGPQASLLFHAQMPPVQEPAFTQGRGSGKLIMLMGSKQEKTPRKTPSCAVASLLGGLPAARGALRAASATCFGGAQHSGRQGGATC